MRVNKTLLNTMNKQNVLNIIRNKGPIYKAEIARITGLSITTVTKIADCFLSRGLIKVTGYGDTDRGKPPEVLMFVPSAHHVIGVDVGTTNITSVLVDLSGKVIFKRVMTTGNRDNPSVVIKKIIESINDTMESSNAHKENIIGIGVGMPGLIDVGRGLVVFSPDFCWENVDLLTSLKQAFHTDIIIDNVTRAMAMGERWFGSGRGKDNFFCVNLGYGIGSAIVINDELYHGVTGKSGELGHMIADPSGPQCACGNYGCLEALSSANAISQHARSRIEQGEPSVITAMVGGDLERIEAKTVFDAARSGDALAISVIGKAIDYLGALVASIINFLDPELIILNGGITKAGAVFIDTLRSVVKQYQMRHTGNKTDIIISSMGDNAAAIGAASLIINKFIENGAMASANGLHLAGN